jgi:predicted nucleotide-binding protein
MTNPCLDVARFLEKLNLEVVILHEQANKGRTVIEKFEQHSDVGFAVVLMTPDDTGSDNLHIIAGEVSRVAEHIS